MLFQWGTFQLHSGGETWWRIDCDAFTDSEIQLIAKLMIEKAGVFHEVVGVPSHPGSCVPKLVEAIKAQNRKDNPFNKHIKLIVDDVLTTGNSMEAVRQNDIRGGPYFQVKGVVIFARGQCPEWVTPLFQM